MKTYRCGRCGQTVHFENTRCLQCGSELGYLPMADELTVIEKEDGFGYRYRALSQHAAGVYFKKCRNYDEFKVCNWMTRVEDNNDFCICCRCNRTIPDLHLDQNMAAWLKLETAKRRVIYSLLRLGLQVVSKSSDVMRGLAFDFLSDAKRPRLKETAKIVTGHASGTITINVAEADDVLREKMRLDMHERYRTLLGHFRHEIGHYYWFLLVEGNSDLLWRFRQHFGDEQQNYNNALKEYYRRGPADGWHQHYISAYASSHPWEDWAETWAHYLHMTDTIETAQTWGIRIEGSSVQIPSSVSGYAWDINDKVNYWFDLTRVMNSLNRSMGMKDPYPFILQNPVIEKLRCIDGIIKQCCRAPLPQSVEASPGLPSSLDS